MIKAILFDMDGVLIDAKDWHYEALNRALKLFGYAISREAHLSTFDGLPTRQKLKILTKTAGLPQGLHEFINALKQSYTLEVSFQRCKPAFNHQFALSKLKADGYRMAVCSNSVRQSVVTMMQMSGLAPYLDEMISNEDVEKGKPDPEMYIKAMDLVGSPPDECLILEDNDHGIQAAVASGGHLLKVGVPADVTYHLIKMRIAEIEAVRRG